MEAMAPGDYFDMMGLSKKAYIRQLDPICKKWSLTRNELDVLLFLHNNPAFDRAADVVARRGIAKSHVSLAVASLEGKGLLARHFEPTDRRTVRLSLTDQGRAIAKEGRAAQQALFAQLFDGITEAEIAVWQEVHRKIGGNLKNMEDRA